MSTGHSRRSGWFALALTGGVALAAFAYAKDPVGAPLSVPGAALKHAAPVDDLSGEWGAAEAIDDLGVGPQGAEQGAEAVDDLSEQDANAAFRTEPLGDSLLPQLLQSAREGEGDPHLPYVLHRLEQAMAAQDLIAFMDLVDSAYFAEQFAMHTSPERSPGRSLNQFTCEFFSLCDVSKSYAYKDVVSAKVISVTPEASGPLLEVALELQVWDGLFLTVEIYYDPRSSRLLSARG